MNHKAMWNMTPLIEAAVYGHAKCVQLLLRAEAKTNVRDRLGRTPLELAVDNEHQAVVRLLLEAESGLW